MTINGLIINKYIKNVVVFLCVVLFVNCKEQQPEKLRSQNPSPMVESIRPHERVTDSACKGSRIDWKLGDKKFRLYIPENLEFKANINLIIHFHGLADVAAYAVCNSESSVLLSVNGGFGSSAYEKPFLKDEVFQDMIARVKKELEVEDFKTITLSGWSAGYGAVRALIRRYMDKIDAVLLLDGLHASYIPEGIVLNEGGAISADNLTPFLDFARLAVHGEKKMLITHSAIFPGTYASTTECSRYLIENLHLEQFAVLKNGPVGMQQVGEVKEGQFRVLSYAGNTAPDHIDHLHGLDFFLSIIEN